jgi:phage tail-like protein
MARAEASDPLHGFRFHVTTETAAFIQDGTEEFQVGEAGFQSVSLPERSVEAVEYREGTMTHTRKFPGVEQFTNCTLMRGVVKTDTAFFDWVAAAAEGGEYRTDMTVYHWHRDGKTHGQLADLDAARKYNMKECFPSRVKIAGDLDATSSEVSLQEVDVEVEWFEIEDAA